MRFIPTALSGVIMIEPDVYRDARGYFLETFHAAKYAQAGIPDYWVVDVDELTITVHRDPSGGRYKTVQRFDRFACVQALLVPEVVVCLDELTH